MTNLQSVLLFIAYLTTAILLFIVYMEKKV